jgi:hypothetical protein
VSFLTKPWFWATLLLMGWLILITVQIALDMGGVPGGGAPMAAHTTCGGCGELNDVLTQGWGFGSVSMPGTCRPARHAAAGPKPRQSDRSGPARLRPSAT